MRRVFRLLCSPAPRIGGRPHVVILKETGEYRLTQGLTPYPLYESVLIPRRDLLFDIASRVVPTIVLGSAFPFGPNMYVPAYVFAHCACQFIPRLTRRQWQAIRQSK